MVVDLTPDDVVQPLEAVPDVESDELLVTVEFRGKRFAVRDTVSLLPMMKFAVIAKRQKAATDRGETGGGEQEMDALAALFELLEQCIAPHDFGAFYDHALSVGASQEELMHVVADAHRARAARPTQRSQPSPGGQSTTGPSSEAGSSSPAWSVPQGSIDVQRHLEEQGRPDMALVVKRAREASRTSYAG